MSDRSGEFCAVVPAWREAERIRSTVEALWGIGCVGEVVVVDDASDDDTAQQARAAGARVVRLPTRRGKAGALWAGVQAARGRHVLLCDADLGSWAAGLEAVCEPVRRGEADLAIAWPLGPKGAGLGLVRRLACAGVRRLGGRGLRSPLSGQRAVAGRWAQALLEGPACGFGAEVRMDVRALRLGLRIAEVPVVLSHRVTGWDWPGVRHRGRQFVDVLKTLWQLSGEALRPCPAEGTPARPAAAPPEEAG